jgi:hypothetical protein
MITKSKRGAEIALNVVIFAVIGLLVLVIVLFILGRKSNQFSEGVSSCEALSGECGADPCFVKGKPEIPNGECPKLADESKRYCCSRAFG